MMTTNRPFVPCGQYATKKAATAAAKELSQTGQKWATEKAKALHRNKATGEVDESAGYCIVRTI